MTCSSYFSFARILMEFINLLFFFGFFAFECSRVWIGYSI